MSRVEPGTRRDLDLLVLDTVSIRAWERLLFVECGDGWIVEEAWRRARRGYGCGLDMSSASVTRAAALRGVLGAVEFRTWDGRHLPWSARFFHQVVSTFALQRSADPAGLLRELRRVLRPGGYLYVIELDHAQERPGGIVWSTFVSGLQRAGFEEAQELSRWEIGHGTTEPLAGVIMVAQVAPLAASSPAARSPSMTPR